MAGPSLPLHPDEMRSLSAGGSPDTIETTGIAETLDPIVSALHATLMSQMASTCFRWVVLAGIAISTARSGLAQTTPDSRVGVRPIAIWPSGPLDVVATFAQPVDPGVARDFIGRTIPYFVAGEPDRIPRGVGAAGTIRIAGARLTNDRRTLVLATDPHPRVARYQLPLPSLERLVTTSPGAPREGVYDLSGVELIWSPDDDAEDAGAKRHGGPCSTRSRQDG